MEVVDSLSESSKYRGLDEDHRPVTYFDADMYKATWMAADKKSYALKRLRYLKNSSERIIHKFIAA